MMDLDFQEENNVGDENAVNHHFLLIWKSLKKMEKNVFHCSSIHFPLITDSCFNTWLLSTIAQSVALRT